MLSVWRKTPKQYFPFFPQFWFTRLSCGEEWQVYWRRAHKHIFFSFFPLAQLLSPLLIWHCCNKTPPSIKKGRIGNLVYLIKPKKWDCGDRARCEFWQVTWAWRAVRHNIGNSGPARRVSYRKRNRMIPVVHRVEDFRLLQSGNVGHRLRWRPLPHSNEMPVPEEASI